MVAAAQLHSRFPNPRDPLRLPRYFDTVDALTDTSEEDTFKPHYSRAWFHVENDIRESDQGTAPPKEQPETTEIIVPDDGWGRECNLFGCTWIPFAEPLDDGPIVEEVDILVYRKRENTLPRKLPGTPLLAHTLILRTLSLLRIKSLLIAA